MRGKNAESCVSSCELLKRFVLIILITCTVWVCAHCVHTQVPEEARRVRAPGARVPGGCEQPDVCTWTRIQVLCKSSICS